ncbi:unnamed protein product [Durusdinium trenchii]|uniref:Hexosyltransferase n=1 Tax=Durusdinium trenchii TaxID=1381693 RepID=A0ABP0QKQ2_9DINO
MMSAFTGPLPACHFRSWASDWRSVRLGCSAVGEKSKVHWKLLKYQLHRCLTNRSSCDVSELLGALLPGARGDERSALQDLCAILGRAEICPAPLPRGSTSGKANRRSWREKDEECWLGSITTMIAAFAVALEDLQRQVSQMRRFLLQRARRYLLRALGRFQIPTLQVLLSGWPILQFLRRLPLVFPQNAESMELHRRAHVLSQEAPRCLTRTPMGTSPGAIHHCACLALKPVAKAATRAWLGGQSLLAQSQRPSARALLRAQDALMTALSPWHGGTPPRGGVSTEFFASQRSELWPLDFWIPSISVNDWLGRAGSVGNWQRSFEGQLFAPEQVQTPDAANLDGLAFATLLEPTEEDFEEWLQALNVMSWSLLRFHANPSSGEQRLAVPLLVLCQQERPLELSQKLLQRNLIPVPVPPVRHHPGGWRRLHLWRFVHLRRILYLDTDVLVTGNLWPLLQLPAAVHFAATGLGLDHQEIRHQRLNSGVMVITPDLRIFDAMGRALLEGLLDEHPEFRLQGYLDQAWVDLFFRYISSEPRGASVIWDEGLPSNASVWEVCPPTGMEEEPPEVKKVPVERIKGAKALPLNETWSASVGRCG